MVQSTGLVISRRPKNTLLMVLDKWPWDKVLPSKPGWMDLHDWVDLLVWLILVTDRNEHPEHAWYRNIDRAFEVLRLTLRKKRIINIDELAVATDTLFSVGQTYQQLCPLFYPVLATIYPQIQDGYRIRFQHMDVTGVYLLLTQE